MKHYGEHSSESVEHNFKNLAWVFGWRTQLEAESSGEVSLKSAPPPPRGFKFNARNVYYDIC